MEQETITLYMVYSDYRSAHLTSAEYIKEEKGIFVGWRMNKNYRTSRDIMPYRIETNYGMERKRIALAPKEAWDLYIEELERNTNHKKYSLKRDQEEFIRSEKLLNHAKKKRDKINVS